MVAHRVVVMGVAGCGKSTLGIALAEELGIPFFDGDDFHPPENVAKMKRGEPLDDDDRAPWLARLAALLADAAGGAVLACSALKNDYRERLRSASEVHFVHLVITPAVAERRLEARAGHFMPSSLIESQFAALETPDEAIAVDGELAVAEIVAVVVGQLARQPNDTGDRP